MIIPCIDLMDSKVVQLVQGKRKVLEGDTPAEMLIRFAPFPELQVIDLDAAMGRGSNLPILEFLVSRSRARVGGGVRTLDHAVHLLKQGAWRIIIGTAAYHKSGINEDFLRTLQREVGKDRIIVALDSRQGRITTEGWRKTSMLHAEEVMPQLEP